MAVVEPGVGEVGFALADGFGGNLTYQTGGPGGLAGLVVSDTLGGSNFAAIGLTVDDRRALAAALLVGLDEEAEAFNK